MKNKEDITKTLKYLVTQGQWEAIMGNNPSRLKNGDCYPVENVSSEDARRFIYR